MCEATERPVNPEAEEISKLMDEKGVRIYDLKQYQEISERIRRLSDNLQALRTKYSRAIDVVKNTLWQKFIDEMGEEAAVDWAEEHIEEEWRDEFCIRRKRYQIVEVTATFKVVIPDDESDYMWDNYVDVDDLDLDWDSERIASDLTAHQAGRYETVNTVEDLEEA